MIYSMTGFGRYLFEEDLWTQVWEIRSTNSKILDIKWHLPQELRSFENIFEKKVKLYAARGRLEISLHLLRNTSTKMKVVFSAEQAEAMIFALTEFAASQGDAYVADYNTLLRIPSLWGQESEDQDEFFEQHFQAGLELALEDWNESRLVEGAVLRKDILARIDEMRSNILFIEELAPEIKKEKIALLRERLLKDLQKNFSPDFQDIDETRFLQEVVILADKIDVTEELVRLNAHFTRLRELLNSSKEVGRKLDFTLQECFREISTCGNKVQDIRISRMIVDCKNELEKCREQVQNIE